MNNTTIKGQGFGKATEVLNPDQVDVKRVWRQGVTAGGFSAFMAWSFLMGWRDFLNSLPTPLALLLILGVFLVSSLFLKVALPVLSPLFFRGMKYPVKKVAEFFGIKTRLKRRLHVSISKAGILKMVAIIFFYTVLFFDCLLHPKNSMLKTIFTFVDALPLWVKICIYTPGTLILGWACVCNYRDKKRLREEEVRKETTSA